MAEKQQKKAPAVPESIIKKRNRDVKLAEKKKATFLKRKKSATAKRIKIAKRAAGYAVEYKRTTKNLVREKRVAKNHGNFYVEPEAKVAFVIRIRGIIGLAPKPKKDLATLEIETNS